MGHFLDVGRKPTSKGDFKVRYGRYLDGAALGAYKVFIEFVPTTDAEREALRAGKQPRLSPERKAFFHKCSPRNSKHTVEIPPATKSLKIDLD